MQYPIEAISNYCNRWCKRCPFTDRCALITAADGELKGQRGDQVPASFPAMSGKFTDFLSRLALVLPRHGGRLDSMVRGADRQSPQPTGLTSGQLKTLAKKVSRAVRKYAKEDWVIALLTSSDYDRPAAQALRSLIWYLPTVAPNYRRSIPRKDTPPSGAKLRSYTLNARLTHLVLVRIIAAITVLLEEPQMDDAKAMIKTLADCFTLLAGIRSLFPDAYKLRRPGFDDPGQRKTIGEFFAGQQPLDPFEDGSWSPGGRPPTT